MFCENEGWAQGSGCLVSDTQLDWKERKQSWLYSLSLHHTCKDTEKAFQTSGSIVTTVHPAWILICYLQIGYGMDAGSTISPLLHCVFNTSLQRKTKYLLYFALPNWRDRGSQELWLYFIERWSFLSIFFFLKRKIRKKKSFGHLSDLFFGMYFSLWVLIFLGYLPGCFFIPDIETFYWYYTTSLLVQSTKWDELQILLLFVDSSFKFF